MAMSVTGSSSSYSSNSDYSLDQRNSQDPQQKDVSNDTVQGNESIATESTDNRDTSGASGANSAPPPNAIVPASDDGLASGDGGRIVKRQAPDPVDSTDQAYRSTASSVLPFGVTEANAAAGSTDAFDNQCGGMTAVALEDVSRGAGDIHTLTDAVNNMDDRLRAPETRQPTIDRIHRAQYESRYEFGGDPENHELHPGTSGLRSGSALADDLRSQFSVRHPSSDGSGTEDHTFAEISLTLGNQQEHAVMLQRVNPSSNYEHDQYDLYDPGYGVYRYNSFDAVAGALGELYRSGYRNDGGLASAWTTYFSDLSTYRPNTPDAQRAELPRNATLADAGGAHGGQWQVPANPYLPPPPADDLPGLSGWEGDHSELKRSAEDSSVRQPAVLYRPSLEPPQQVKSNQGFFLDDTLLHNVNLDAHDAGVAAKPGLVDGAGYLGTYNSSEMAQQHLRFMNTKGGYIYDIAPSPNMVDVAGSLGTGARTPSNGEVAAMGGIDWTQVRGWREMSDGKLGAYTANPDYRWDVYDQMHTAGARPELAHFSPENAAWGDDRHKLFATPFEQDGKTLYRLNEDPSLVQARFFAGARAKIDHEATSQSQGLDYRGPVTIRPAWSNNDGDGPARLQARTSGGSVWPSIDASSGSNTNDQMRFGDDGRIHLANDDSKVLRIGSDGYAYFGAVPVDPHNTNGVFTYSDSRGLQHMEDGKWLTEGSGSAYAVPYLSGMGGEHGGLAPRQTWYLRDPRGNDVEPPMSRAEFKDGSAGSGEQLYQFYRDADSALPAGATRFVTGVLGRGDFADQNFVGLPDKIKPEEAMAIEKWLAANNAAWLFKDGYYAVSGRGNTLEVRNLGGKTVWVAAQDTPGQLVFRQYTDKFASDYQVPSRPWEQVKESEKRESRLRQPKPM